MNVGRDNQPGRIATDDKLRNDEIAPEQQADDEEDEARPDIAADQRRHGLSVAS